MKFPDRWFSKEDTQINTYDRMFNMSKHEGNTNQSHTELSPHPS
jgi:hypothetical protein